MDEQEEQEERTQSNHKQLISLIRQDRHLARSFGLMEVSAKLYALGYRWSLEALRKKTTDARATELTDDMREMVAQKVEGGFDDLETLRSIRDEILPFIESQIRVLQREASEDSMKQAALAAQARAETPVVLPNITLLRGEITILAAPRSVLRILLRDAAAALRKGVSGVHRMVGASPTDDANWQGLPMLPGKGWIASGTNRKKIDAWFHNAIDLFLMHEFQLVLDADETEADLQDWLRHCKRAAEQKHTAVLLTIPCSDVIGAENAPADAVAPYREHHTCYTAMISRRQAHADTVTIQPGNKKFELPR